MTVIQLHPKRPYRSLTEVEQEQILAMRADEVPVREIARTIGRPVMTVSAFCKRAGVSPTTRGGSYLSRRELLMARELGLPTC